MKVITTVEGEPITQEGDGRVWYHAKAAVDVDGTGSSHGDPDYQPHTSYKPDLNADKDHYIVVPPAIIKGVVPVVLGAKARVTNEKTGQRIDVVVGDVGPRLKLGELSRACALALGIDPSPVSGGMDEHRCFYEIWPGVAAPGYHLQPS